MSVSMQPISLHPQHRKKLTAKSVAYLFWKMHCRLLKLEHHLRKLNHMKATTPNKPPEP